MPNPDSRAAAFQSVVPHMGSAMATGAMLVGLGSHRPSPARKYAFGKPVLVLGDPGQLPPIKGEGAFNSDTPDVLLTEVHRQAAESAIIRSATAARQATNDHAPAEPPVP